MTRQDTSRELALAEEVPLLKLGDMTEEFLNAWNSLPQPFPKIKTISSGRARALKARLAEPFFRENYGKAIEAMPGCPFLRGVNPRQWVADVEFFLRPDSVAKIVEGKYAPAKTGPETKPAIGGIKWGDHL